MSSVTPPGAVLHPAQQLAAAAVAHPDKAAVMHGERVMTYGELARQASGVAHLLRDMGVRPGDRVATLVRKDPEAIVAFLGVMSLGAAFVPLDCNNPPAMAQALLRRAGVSACIVDASFWEALTRLGLPDVHHPTILIRTRYDGPGEVAASSLESVEQIAADPGPTQAPHVRFWEEAVRDWSAPPPAVPHLGGETVVYLNITSGTTGRAKGAVTTAGHIHWNTRAAVEHFRMTSDDVHCCMMPPFVHPHELFARPLALGGTMVLTQSIRPDVVARVLAARGVTCFMAVATIYETLTRLTREKAYDLNALRVAESGGMHVPATLTQRFQDRHGAHLLPVWGSTETAGIALATPLPEVASPRPGSMGVALPYYDIQLLDDQGDVIAHAKPDVIGALHVMGPAVCNEYAGDPEETANAFGPHGFRTGDNVRRDADGFHYFEGRAVGMLKVGGMKVFPTVVEETLREHPAVAETVVVKVDDALRGEAARAVVVLRDDSASDTVDAAALRRFLETRLHRYKVPRYIDIIEAIPKTPGGKIAWRMLS